MKYILFIGGMVLGIGIGAIFAFEIESKKEISPDMIYDKELEPLEEGYKYTGYYAFYDDKWYPVIRKVEDNE